MSSTGAVIMAVAKKAQKKIQKDAKAMAKEAALEADRKAKCLLFEKGQRTEIDYDLVTPPPKLTMKEQTKGGACIFSGSYVLVEPDLSPNKFSHGGNGWVINFQGTGPHRTFTVRYDRCSTAGVATESGIPYSRITQIPNPAYEVTNNSRKRKASSPAFSTSESSSDSTVLEDRPLEDILEHGWKRNRAKGWRAKDLGVHPTNPNVKRSDEHDRLFHLDLKELKTILRLKGAGATNNKDLKDGDGKFQRQRNSGGQYTTKYKKSKPLSISYLNHAWGVGKNYANRVVNRNTPEPLKADDESTVFSSSIIESYAAAEVWFNPRSCFIRHTMVMHGENDNNMAYDSAKKISNRKDYRACAVASWDVMGAEERAQWEAFSRRQLCL